MYGLKKYRNKSGYEISVTEKAYNLYYRQQGFTPVEEAPASAAGNAGDDAQDNGNDNIADENVTSEDDTDDVTDEEDSAGLDGMNTKELKTYLDSHGIGYDKKAVKSELLKLAKSIKE